MAVSDIVHGRNAGNRDDRLTKLLATGKDACLCPGTRQHAPNVNMLKLVFTTICSHVENNEGFRLPYPLLRSGRRSHVSTGRKD